MRQLDICKLTLSAILILLPPPPFPVRAGDQPIKLPVVEVEEGKAHQGQVAVKPVE